MPVMTYRELSDALGIAPASAYRLALRRRWPRTKGNDGRTKVSVPDEALTRHSDSPTVSQNDNQGVSHPDSQNDSHLMIARLEGELIGLREALVDARAHAATLQQQLAAAEARAGTARADLAAEQARTTQAIRAFESLAERLEAIAEAQRPWWRRLRMTG
jgi:UDP-N-acetylmuramoylalanine-D-glutamate ligase